MIDTVLFDLDGTLLPMDQEEFVKMYMGLLAKKLAAHGYEPKKLVDAVWKGTLVMMKNDGTVSNETAFWNYFQSCYDHDVRKDVPLFDEFYEKDFRGAKNACGFNHGAGELVAWLKGRGVTVALATNPLFPATATMQRTAWAGLDPHDFALITTYENSRCCKPSLEYYRDVLKELGKTPEQCVMVGNDAQEDMAAAALGMKTFLLTDCLIDRKGDALERFPHGGYGELRAFLEENIQ